MFAESFENSGNRASVPILQRPSGPLNFRVADRVADRFAWQTAWQRTPSFPRAKPERVPGIRTPHPMVLSQVRPGLLSDASLTSIRNLLVRVISAVAHAILRSPSKPVFRRVRAVPTSGTIFLDEQRPRIPCPYSSGAISIIDNEIGLMKRDPQHAGDRELLDDMVTALKDRETMNVCVCSFSERGDVLSQWRAYSGAAGFSIGF